MDFVATRIFDTVIAARLLGIRAFSLAALVERYFGITLAKGSQKANWAQRPLPKHMAEYAMNDTRYLLPLAEKLEAELRERERLDWFRQSCERQLEQTAVKRVRDEEEVWRISGAGKLGGRASAILRELWQWRDREAQRRSPGVHILQNHLLLEAAEAFAAGESPDYRHFSARRRQVFATGGAGASWRNRMARPAAAEGKRPTPAMERAAEQLRRRRDAVADKHGLEPLSLPHARAGRRGRDESQSSALLVPWQRSLLECAQASCLSNFQKRARRPFAQPVRCLCYAVPCLTRGIQRATPRRS